MIRHLVLGCTLLSLVSALLFVLSIQPSGAVVPGYNGSIVFSRQNNGGAYEGDGIYTVDPSTGSLDRLTSGLRGDVEPSWSPTGDTIAFASMREWDYQGQPQSEYNIWELDSTGGNLRNLSHAVLPPNPLYGQFHRAPTWSPDSSQIAFEGYDTEISGDYRIYVMNADGTNRHVLGSASDDTYRFGPDWSPDGTRIAFTAMDDNTPVIRVINSDGSGETQLTSAFSTHPSWSPDGTMIAFAGIYDEPSNVDIYVMNADGSNLRRLTTDPGEDDYPSWSPDGQRIVWSSSRTNFWTYTLWTRATVAA